MGTNPFSFKKEKKRKTRRRKRSNEESHIQPKPHHKYTSSKANSFSKSCPLPCILTFLYKVY